MEFADVDQRAKTIDTMSCSYLQLATIEGVIQPNIDIAALCRRVDAPTRRSFLRQLFLDFAVACEMYHPVKPYEALERAGDPSWS